MNVLFPLFCQINIFMGIVAVILNIGYVLRNGPHKWLRLFFAFNIFVSTMVLWGMPTLKNLILSVTVLIGTLLSGAIVDFFSTVNRKVAKRQTKKLEEMIQNHEPVARLNS